MTVVKIVSVIAVVFLAGLYCGTHIQLRHEGGAASRKGVLSRCDVSNQQVADSHATQEDNLLQGKREIAMQETQRSRLMRQMEQMDLPLAESTTIPELMDRVERLPADLIYQQLENLFDREYVERVEDPHDFAKRLIEVALSEGSFGDNIESETDSKVALGFSLSPVAGLREFVSLDEVEQHERIFVHFSSPSTFQNLIVRWQHAESGEILQFSPLNLLGNQGSYISLQPRGGWRTGIYQVSVYDLSAQQHLVGAGSYRVSGVRFRERQADEPDHEVIEDLVSSGRAALKSY